MNKHRQWPKVQALSYQLLIIAKKKKVVSLQYLSYKWI